MKALLSAFSFVALALLAPQTPAAQDSADSLRSLSRPGDGSAVCGLGRQFHAGRREALCAALGKGIVVCRGLPEPRDYQRFRQDKAFWYLTGIESPHANLVIEIESRRAILFLPGRDRFSESWNGEVWDAADEWVKDLTGFAEVRKNSELIKVLEELSAKVKTVWVPMNPHVTLAGAIDQAEGYDRGIERDELDGRPSREKRLAERLKEVLGVDVKDLSPALDELRRIKAPEEIQAMRRAGRAGALAMAEAMRSTRPGLGEWDLEALMSFVQVREGAEGPAYGAIVGSGPNSLVMHYMSSTRALKDGEVVLIDYAPEVDHYTCDITRTWPANGSFSARQAELYDAVLEAQKAGIAAVKPGATMSQIGAACAKVFQQRGLDKFQRHPPCHYIGLEVHDVGDASKPLEPGVAFTVEPGLYEPATGIGIRIEDVVIVTPGGCEIVSELAPKERVEIERLVREEGVLDWMSRAPQSATATKKP